MVREEHCEFWVQSGLPSKTLFQKTKTKTTVTTKKQIPSWLTWVTLKGDECEWDWSNQLSLLKKIQKSERFPCWPWRSRVLCWERTFERVTWQGSRNSSWELRAACGWQPVRGWDHIHMTSRNWMLPASTYKWTSAPDRNPALPIPSL
jgi:hypothetical protein